jgi:anti-sigma B factor antagonist
MDKIAILSWRTGNSPDVKILAVSGPLLISNFFNFQTAIRESHSPTLIVDLTDVPYMDSAALGCIIGGHVAAGRANTRFALAGAAERIMTMFQTSGVASLLSFFPTVEAAEAELA